MDLTGNEVGLIVGLANSAVVLAGIIITRNRVGSIKETAEAVHDAVRTSNGHSIGELVEQVANDYSKANADSDAAAVPTQASGGET